MFKFENLSNIHRKLKNYESKGAGFCVFANILELLQLHMHANQMMGYYEDSHLGFCRPLNKLGVRSQFVPVIHSPFYYLRYSHPKGPFFMK